MRQEDKEVDGFELERAEEQRHKSERVAEPEEELLELEGQSRDPERSSLIMTAMQTILGREHIVINNLHLSQRERRALEALKTAVDGRDQALHNFVFAEDRRALLEQALAVLQPDLVQFEEAGGRAFEELVQDVTQLRERIGELQAAQFELLRRKRAAAKGEASDTDDKDDDDDTSLTGPERTIEKPASSLTGPERKPEPKPESTLTGPERKPEPKQPTTLGDPKEIAAAATPWWKRA